MVLFYCAYNDLPAYIMLDIEALYSPCHLPFQGKIYADAKVIKNGSK